uniref:Zinc finger protein ZPR1 homolog (Trinotate prediction) n=1 Tax=Henneguya salminicola TaxID=69463 RepID=A0A6G3MK25_HENSL
MLQGNQKFTFLIDDPSGNSCIENTSFPNADPNLWILKYKRTRHEDSLLHLDVDSRKPIVISDEEDINNNKENDDSRVYKLPDVCRTCWKPICINLQKLCKDFYQ